MTEWATPIRKLRPNEMWCVWNHNGVYEWMVPPLMAENLLRTGIKADGEWCPVTKIDEWPDIGAWQIRAVKPGRQGHDEYVMTAAAA